VTQMSAIGPKQTWAFALHMSAFRCKADITIAACPLSRSLLGVKRTSLFAPHMSASDPKRTSLAALHMSAFVDKVAETRKRGPRLNLHGPVHGRPRGGLDQATNEGQAG